MRFVILNLYCDVTLISITAIELGSPWTAFLLMRICHYYTIFTLFYTESPCEDGDNCFVCSHKHICILMSFHIYLFIPFFSSPPWFPRSFPLPGQGSVLWDGRVSAGPVRGASEGGLPQLRWQWLRLPQPRGADRAVSGSAAARGRACPPQHPIAESGPANGQGKHPMAVRFATFCSGNIASPGHLLFISISNSKWLHFQKLHAGYSCCTINRHIDSGPDQWPPHLSFTSCLSSLSYHNKAKIML